MHQCDESESFCLLSAAGEGSIVAASGVTAQSQASAHIADLLSVCEVAMGRRGGGEGLAAGHNAIITEEAKKNKK